MPPGETHEQKKARLAAALRENLKRRKAQGRARLADAAEQECAGAEGKGSEAADVAAKDAKR
ncbi:MAG: hypothetical protein MRY74_16760 [Neomegalonema sp.]|nr:hypothetical protein [Neomegalonema sp.]